MKILITGAAGFLGFHLSQQGIKHKLTLLDIAPFNKKEYPKKADFIDGDVRDKKLIDKVTAGQNVVIHAAAALPLWKKEDIMTTNINGMANILTAAKKNKVKRVIFISSTAVYGVPKRHPIYETDERVGVGPYGESKIMAEDLCFEAMKQGLHVTILRPKTFVGTHRLGVFEILFDWIHDGKRIPVVGSGMNRYQLLDVDDLVSAVYRFSETSDKKYDDFFNIAAEQFYTVQDDLGKLFRYAKSGSRIMRTPAYPIKKALWLFEKLHLSPLYQWVYDTADKDSFVSIDKLTKTLKWHPRYSNSEALIKAYQWYLDNYADIKSRPAGLTHTVGWKQGILGFIKRFL